MGYSPRTSRKKNTMCPSRDNSGRCPWMTIRSKQWYTKTSSFPNRERNVSIGRLLVFLLLQQDLRSDGRWNQIHCLATKSTPWDFQGRSPWLCLANSDCGTADPEVDSQPRTLGPPAMVSLAA